MTLPEQKYLTPLFFLFLTGALFLTCKKHDVDGMAGNEIHPDFTKTAVASVTGFVTNENGMPLTGATVNYGISSTTTDKYGYFEIKNATVTENAGVVNVKMAGYFKGIKTFIAEAGKNNFCRVKLIPKTNTGSVDASSGGSVALSNGLSVTIPANGVIDAATKTAYSGTITVSSFWIDPTANDVDEIMPGDLRGLNENGSLKSLTSFGMAAVELTGNSGQLLQIADGKKVTLNFPLPNTVAADAPASIPLWYFDETKGLWIEEGTAIKSGNTYVGDVKHFTYWNCDLPNPSVPLSFIITDNLLNRFANAHVEITPLTTNSWSHAGGYTDETGYVNVSVTANTQYKLEIFSNGCSSAIPFSKKTFSVESKAVDLGIITVGETSADLATITGTATDCNNNPLSNGRIIAGNGSFFTIILL